MLNILQTIKQAAIEAVNASDPTGVLFGTVVSISPLKINVEQRLTLDESFLILTTLVKDFEVEMTVDHFTEDDDYLITRHTHPEVAPGSFDSTHKHAYKGKKKFLVHLGLKMGDGVILIKVQGGQKFIVLDRI